jgi:hypothetical protein
LPSSGTKLCGALIFIEAVAPVNYLFLMAFQLSRLIFAIGCGLLLKLPPS